MPIVPFIFALLAPLGRVFYDRQLISPPMWPWLRPLDAAPYLPAQFPRTCNESKEKLIFLWKFIYFGNRSIKRAQAVAL